MSQENVEVVKAWLLAFEEDRDAFSALTHPAIEWMPFEDTHTPTRGVDGALRIRDGWLDAPTSLHLRASCPHAITDRTRQPPVLAHTGGPPDSRARVTPLPTAK